MNGEVFRTRVADETAELARCIGDNGGFFIERYAEPPLRRPTSSV